MKYTKYTAVGLLSLSLLFSGIFSSCNNPQPTDPQPYGALPTKHQLEWQKMEYYMFVHFGPNTFTNVEWGDGKEDPKVFNPTDVDCQQWAATAKAAGMRGIILTVKHHDGFCLWPSQYSTHTVRESPWKDGKGDILRKLAEACKECDLKLGVYLSPWDQNHPEYGTAQYNQTFSNTLSEVLGNYGEIFEQWFDGANGGDGHPGKKQEYDWGLFHNTVYKLQPHIIIFSDIGPGCRWMGNERGIAGETNWSRLNIEGFGLGYDAPPTDTLNMGNVHGKAWIPAETDVSIRPGWFYSPSTDDKVKTLDHLLNIYYSSVGRNSNLLLNVPPDRRGRIHPNDSTRLMEFRRAVDQIFKDDLAKGAKISASEVRSNSEKYSANNLLDDKYDSYWTTNDDTTTASIELDLGSDKTFNRVLLQEYIPLGQRVAKFNIEAFINNEWQQVVEGTTIGYKRILRFSLVTAQKIRINIHNSLACPILNQVGLYMADEQLSTPIITRSKEGMVSINCSTPDPVIYYTTNGSEPSTTSLPYKEAFTLPLGGTVKAMATISNGSLMSEAVVVDFDIAPLKWSIKSPSGSEAAIDGNANSWTVIKDNEALVVDLGDNVKLKGFTYMPQANEKANNVYRYNLYVSTNGSTWNKVVSNASFNNIKNNPIKQDVKFAKEVTAQLIKLEPIQTTNNSKDYVVAELGVITK